MFKLDITGMPIPTLLTVSEISSLSMLNYMISLALTIIVGGAIFYFSNHLFPLFLFLDWNI